MVCCGGIRRVALLEGLFADESDRVVEERTGNEGL